VTKYLKSGGARCPLCQSPAKMDDRRPLFTPKKLLVVDTSETEALRAALAKVAGRRASPGRASPVCGSSAEPMSVAGASSGGFPGENVPGSGGRPGLPCAWWRWGSSLMLACSWQL
jgi:hypothetical protein